MSLAWLHAKYMISNIYYGYDLQSELVCYLTRCMKKNFNCTRSMAKNTTKPMGILVHMRLEPSL